MRKVQKFFGTPNFVLFFSQKSFRMMALFKNKYRIETNRLKGFDYSKGGLYFITLRIRVVRHTQNTQIQQFGGVFHNFGCQNIGFVQRVVVINRENRT